MIEALKAIAMLCAIHTGSSDESYSMKIQRECQIYYARCLEDGKGKGHGYDVGLLICAKDLK